MLEISPNTSIHELIEAYPFLADFLAEFNPRFALLKNPVMRATAGRVATLRKASEMGGVDLEELMDAIRKEVSGATGTRPGVDPSKVADLKALILDLHDGVDPETARARFDEVVREASPAEIGAMEEQLIREGMPVAEIQRLCDLHVAVVQGSLDGQEEVNAPPGHPIHTYLAANEVITDLANRLGEISSHEVPETPSPEALAEEDVGRWVAAFRNTLDALSGIDNHYLRKENELFPVLERHGITGPSQVMWGVHDEIRALFKKVDAALTRGEVEEAAAGGASLARSVIEMVYKEKKILLPLAKQTLTEEEWLEVRRGEDELGYAFREPSAPFPVRSDLESSLARSPGRALPIVSAAPPSPLPSGPELAYVDLGTGRLSLEQVDMILRHLPIEISFVDAEGFVRYYSDTAERLFPRTPGAIGRHVENCHPPKSVHMVKEILRKFADGERDVAEFWIEMGGRCIHIRYFAVRNQAGTYLGCLEVTQDVTDIRALEGERRLLEWT